MTSGRRLVGKRKQQLISKIESMLKKLHLKGLNVRFVEKTYLNKNFYTTKELSGVISELVRLEAQ